MFVRYRRCLCHDTESGVGRRRGVHRQVQFRGHIARREYTVLDGWGGQCAAVFACCAQDLRFKKGELLTIISASRVSVLSHARGSVLYELGEVGTVVMGLESSLCM